jgi:sulfonate dioxygenase
MFLPRLACTPSLTRARRQVQALHELLLQSVAFLRTHSSVEQAEFSRRGHCGGIVRRKLVKTVHPLVRQHPVTGDEAPHVSRRTTRSMGGLKREESENLLRFLYDHIDEGGD